MLPDRLAFIDLETTGADPARDRITEIGIVTVEGGSVSRWSSFVNPGQPIPPFIQRMTGITDAMVEHAPDFAAVADELRARLDGRLFVAHNARFDYGFVRQSYRRIGQTFRADVLCTVRLSRKLWPEHHRHGLDSLIERHGLRVEGRHRGLADAELIHQFWQIVTREHAPEAIAAAIDQQLQRPSLPPHLPPDCLDDLPETPGVYRFHGENDALLYVGKSVNLRSRVLSHFSASASDAHAQRIAREIRRLDWTETAGELGALLLEAKQVRDLQPLHNRRLRRESALCAWTLTEVAAGDYRPHLVSGADADPGRAAELYGLFATRREATLALRKIAEAHQLCLARLGLENTTRPGAPCFARQLQRCRGACVGAETPGLHSARLMSALARLRLATWPWPGAIGIVERNDFLDREDVHVVDAWRHLGTARNESDIAVILAGAGSVQFDIDTYKLLKSELIKSRLDIRQLPRTAAPDEGFAPP